MDIYVKAQKKLEVSEFENVRLKDFAEVMADRGVKETVENISFSGSALRQVSVYLVSVIDIVTAIKNIYPDAHIINVGEKDTIISRLVNQQENVLYKWLKIAFVSLTLLFGSATAIMSFFSDAEIAKVLENFYYLVFRVKNDKPLIVEIPYSIGIASGIIVFFNHFAGKKIMEDPTPIEVEMVKYDSDVTDTFVNNLSSNGGRIINSGEAEDKN